MNLKETKEQVKIWARNNKGKILLGAGVLAGFAMVAICTSKPKEKEDSVPAIEAAPEEEFDEGGDLEIHFVVPENGEVLWKELCTESFMNDCKEVGMQYESIRKLNGLE